MPDLLKQSMRGSSAALAGGVKEFLLFNLAEDAYAVELAGVREILSPPALTKVPRAPHDVMGVCSVRGLLVTVFDLRRRLRVAPTAATRSSRILLTTTAEAEVVGVFVDEVRHVVRMDSTDIENAQSVLGGDTPDHVLGVGRTGGEVIVVLDLVGMVS